MPNEEELIHLNGIDGATGQYLVQPFSRSDAANFALGVPEDSGLKQWMHRIWQAMQRPFMGLPMDIDPCLPSQAGWAVVFGPDATSEVQSALEPLIQHRQRVVPADRCKVLNYRGNEELKEWLKRHGVYPGTVAPTKVPYYLLLVGNPSAVPFQFQYLLDIEYAVGRLAFATAAEYRQYAESVVEYETSNTLPNSREIVYWAARHAADRATQMSADYLVKPLYEGTTDDGGTVEPPIAGALSFESRCLSAKDATKARLAELLHAPGSAKRPAMLFAASHGMGWPIDHEQHDKAQGALLCQDWSGFGSVNAHQFLVADEIEDDARLHGVVAFLFACFAAGTPAHDSYLVSRSGEPLAIAAKPVIARLPQRLLAHPQGSALAVLGHVDRAWGYSIRPPRVGPQLQPFRNLIGRILSGQPVGHATKDFSDRYAVLSSQLASKLDSRRTAERISDDELAQDWIERNDAQNYIMLGDPAVSLRVDLLK